MRPPPATGRSRPPGAFSGASVRGDTTWPGPGVGGTRATSAQALALIEQGHRHLILDLAAVTFCDSSGFNALVGIFRCAQAAEGTLVLAAVPDRLARLLDLTGLNALLPARPTAAHALVAHPHPDPSPWRRRARGR
ncbi:STAS domain-containing protein [Streptomyces cyaneofuscatus]|uniref:STAS domain-containing protein n=1 Tax=Streptomyces cyaneofuscatus TaxID=66883 RepID=UPI0036747CA7